MILYKSRCKGREKTYKKQGKRRINSMKNREKQKCRVDHQVRLRCQCYAKNIS